MISPLIFLCMALAHGSYLRSLPPRSLQEWNRFYNTTTGNFIQNADFSSNYSFFSSNYTLTATPNTLIQGSCGLGSSGALVNSAYTPCSDHTSNVTATSPSSALYCNLTSTGLAVWYQTLNATNVTTASYYKFSAWVALPRLQTTPVSLAFEVQTNGTSVWQTLGVGNTTTTACVVASCYCYTQLAFYYSPPGNVSFLYLRIRSVGADVDFGLDDLYFGAVGGGGSSSAAATTTTETTTSSSNRNLLLLLLLLLLLPILFAVWWFYWRKRKAADKHHHDHHHHHHHGKSEEKKPEAAGTWLSHLPTLFTLPCWRKAGPSNDHPSPTEDSPPKAKKAHGVKVPAVVKVEEKAAGVASPPKKVASVRKVPPAKPLEKSSEEIERERREEEEDAAYLARKYKAEKVPHFAGGGVVLHGGHLEKTVDKAGKAPKEGRTWGDAKLKRGATDAEKLASGGVLATGAVSSEEKISKKGKVPHVA